MNEGEYHNNVETKLTDSSFCSRINKLDLPTKHTHKIWAIPTSAEYP